MSRSGVEYLPGVQVPVMIAGESGSAPPQVPVLVDVCIEFLPSALQTHLEFFD